MTRFVCIHGHFYQPPRESPWSGEIEPQPSAAPFENWNERITAECYAPNAAAQILNSAGKVVRSLNNYSAISFNFGPTLLSWIERKAPETYAAILRADRESAARFGGHGSALAQAYNHMVLPLANARDRRTQISWGIGDFTHRFGRQPEGMWLPETAVNLATLDALAEQDIRFTILAPSQAFRVRPFDVEAWVDVCDGDVDTTVPYLVNLPSGRSIVVCSAAPGQELTFGAEPGRLGLRLAHSAPQPTGTHEEESWHG